MDDIQTQVQIARLEEKLAASDKALSLAEKLAVPLGFEVPEILKCPSCDAQWVFLKMARNEIRAQLSAEYSLREKTA